MNIDMDTRFVTLIGTPLSQSFAARMQNAAYAAGGINMVYFYTEADETHLGEIIRGIRCMPSFAGCAVTKPNKVKVLEYLDELDPLCEKMGACNTVVRRNDRLVGYNTDGVGFLQSLRKEAGILPEDHVFFCIGAGGAGRAMCSALAYSGARKIYISDLHRESAECLVQDMNRNFSVPVELVPYGQFAAAERCTVIMNASGIGMGHTIGESPFPAECIRSDQFFFDSCYNPDRTQFIRNAEDKGCTVLNGLGMSLYQGAAQIELWTGRNAPVEAMRKELREILKEKGWIDNHTDGLVFAKR